MVNERKMERTYDRGNERMNIQSDGGIIWNERKEGRIYAKRGGKWIKKWGEQGTKGIVKCTSFSALDQAGRFVKEQISRMTKVLSPHHVLSLHHEIIGSTALWSGTNKNRDASTGPLARPFARGKVNF